MIKVSSWRLTFLTPLAHSCSKKRKARDPKRVPQDSLHYGKTSHPVALQEIGKFDVTWLLIYCGWAIR